MKATDGRRGPRSPEWNAHISQGLRRARWSHAQADLAEKGLPHDLVPAKADIQLHRGLVLKGDCHWCAFFGRNGPHNPTSSE